MVGRRLLAVVALVAAALPLGAAASAQSPGTIAFIRDGQVWVATPDGSQERQLTTEGFWRGPSIDDQGVVAAVRDEDVIVRMTQDGQVLSEVVPEALLAAGAGEAILDPAGALIAYTTIEDCSTATIFIVCRTGVIMAAEGSGEPLSRAGGVDHPAWLPSGDLAMDFSGDLVTMTPGQDDATPWADDGAYDDQTISRDGRFLAGEGSRFHIGFSALDGPPPAPPRVLECGFDLGPDVSVDDIRYGPTSDRLVFEVLGEGVHIATGVDPVGCQGSEELVFPGASDPYWSPVAFGQTAGGTPGGPGTPGDPGGGLPEGVSRFDGGGAADPIGQAVALSQALFEDGAATRVVLATADRFPDALAGAALAGPDGPILFTSGTGGLDPRTAAEIARVTGGSAPVLVLGGTSAVSEEAAAAARSAGGDAPCTSPLPASCRFAGTGREQTAALIADAVAAADPDGVDVAMVARSDDFADALTGGAFAAATGIPILLTPTTLAHPEAVAWLEATRPETLVVLGGTSAISEETAQGLPAGTRLRVSGADRTATSAAIAEQLWGAALQGSPPPAVGVVNVRAADGWQTALSAAVASALFVMPQLGVEGPPAGLGADVATYLGTVPAGTPVLGFGDAALVSDAQLAEVAAALR